MMIGFSSLMGNSGDAGDAHESGGASGGSSEIGAASSSIPGGGGVEDSGGGAGGGGANRWPSQETLALLKIRSEMDGVFRDSSLKGPLWEEVSRKMAELGFQRNAKKCKEKFENVYKYHKRTKDGRSSKSDTKTYRYSDQLQALENAPPPPSKPPPLPTILPHSSISPNPVSMVLPPLQQPQPAADTSNPPQIQPPARLFSNMTSSSTSSDEDIHRRRGQKRKWKTFFQKLMSDVIQKQENMQKTFLESLEKRERDRIEREEVWRMQERARLNRDHELLVQERSMAAAKDAAVIGFLKKVTDEHSLQIPISISPIQDPPHPPPPQPPPPEAAPIPPKSDKIGENLTSRNSSRWPKAEVQALIKLRTNLDLKYHETGPKGPLWEEISAAMAELGYNRSSKRCKEKWENINKYFKKVKEGNRKRSEDGKTCPYFHQLDAIYRERESKSDPSLLIKPDNPPPIMARPEQQWPQPQQPPPAANSSMPDDENNSDHGEDEDDGDDEEEEEDEYNVVANKQPVE